MASVTAWQCNRYSPLSTKWNKHFLLKSICSLRSNNLRFNHLNETRASIWRRTSLLVSNGKARRWWKSMGAKKCQRKCQVAGLCERSAGVRPLVYKQKRPSRAALWPVQPQKHVWHSCSKRGRSSTCLISIQFKISHEGRCLAVRLRSSGSAKKNIKVDYLNCFLHGQSSGIQHGKGLEAMQ